MTLPLNPSPADEKRFLTANGFTHAEQAALALLWGNNDFEPLLGYDPYTLRYRGYGPAAVLDSIFHELDEEATSFYNRHGFTTHEAHLIETDLRAQNNLADRDADEMEELFGSDLPRGLLFQILFVSTDPEDLDASRLRHEHAVTGTPETDETTGIVDTVASYEAAIGGVYALSVPPTGKKGCCK